MTNANNATFTVGDDGTVVGFGPANAMGDLRGELTDDETATTLLEHGVPFLRVAYDGAERLGTVLYNCVEGLRIASNARRLSWFRKRASSSNSTYRCGSCVKPSSRTLGSSRMSLEKRSIAARSTSSATTTTVVTPATTTLA